MDSYAEKHCRLASDCFGCEIQFFGIALYTWNLPYDIMTIRYRNVQHCSNTNSLERFKEWLPVPMWGDRRDFRHHTCQSYSTECFRNGENNELWWIKGDLSGMEYPSQPAPKSILDNSVARSTAHDRPAQDTGARGVGVNLTATDSPT